MEEDGTKNKRRALLISLEQGYAPAPHEKRDKSALRRHRTRLLHMNTHMIGESSHHQIKISTQTNKAILPSAPTNENYYSSCN